MPGARAFVRPLWVGLVLLAAAVALGVWVHGGPLGIDRATQEFFVSVRGPALESIAFALNWVGGGWFAVYAVPLLGAALLALRRRFWAAGYFVAALAVSALFVQIVKHVFGRVRPDDMIVVSDFGSFPSGHTANAATMAVVLAVLFPRVWVAVAGAAWMALMAMSRMLLGAHWLTDTVAGALLGASAALLVAAAMLRPLAAEARRASAPDGGAARG
ncbi:MAG: phosphatase PAP2 family protein [Microbacterium sp.]|uniref:phosphatase PAP2 family protein n=1 Tax=Microbacterium sp. TaxID=51671 RepID=UPI0039E2FB68